MDAKTVIRMPAMQITSPMAKKKYIVKTEAPGRVDGVQAEPGESVGGEKLMTGKEAATHMGKFGVGEYYKPFWGLIQKLGLEDKQLKVKFDDNGGLSYVKDPDTGKELIGGEWKDSSDVTGEKPGGMMKGGEVKASCAEGGPVAEAPPAAPEAPTEEAPEGSAAAGTFEKYSKTANMDPELIKRGNSLFTNLERAIGQKDELETQRFVDELNQFIKDLETVRTEAVSQANDSVLAAALKEMATDAQDLLSAYQTMSAETPTPEAEAAAIEGTESGVTAQPPSAG